MSVVRMAQAETMQQQILYKRLRFAKYLILVVFIVVLVRTAYVPYMEPKEQLSASAETQLLSQRADIVDRNGLTLATNLPTHSLYAHPKKISSEEAAKVLVNELGKIFPEIDKEIYFKKLTSDKQFVWIRDKLSPEQFEAILNISEVGLEFGPRETRVYPNGNLASHILGGARYGEQGVNSAEVIGAAGVELSFDNYLRDPVNGGNPLVLSMDLKSQSVIENVLKDGVYALKAVGGSAILMDAHSGEIYAMASYPDFDPNHRGSYDLSDSTEKNPLFNQALQGVIEPGSVFKVFAIATALELGLVEPETVIKTTPFKAGGYVIKDGYSPRNERTVIEIMIKSSNVGVARLALNFGAKNQKAFLRKLGFDKAVDIEISEATTGIPTWSSPWADSTTATVSYGYGLSITPLHLAAGFAAIINGGFKVDPTILRRDISTGERIALISPETSSEIRSMLSLNVEKGSATSAQIDGYQIGGKTGTAQKIKNGKYTKNLVRTTFVSCFPADDPRFVLVVILNEPKPDDVSDILAGNSVVPVAAEMLTRLVPVLGIRPQKRGAPSKYVQNFR